MSQTITSIAALGSRYLSGIQYRVFNTANAFYPGPGDNLADGTHLGQGIWRAVATLPVVGGEVRWYSNGGTVLLAVDAIASTLAPQQTEILQLCEAFVQGQVEVNYISSTMTQYNRNGTIRQIFSLRDINNQPATSGADAVKRIPVV